MVNIFLRWIAYSLAIMFVAWLIPGISIVNFLTAMLVSVVMALINTFVKPILQFISLPLNFLTLGLFALVINALLFMLAGFIVPGFTVEGFLSAFFGSIVLSLLVIGISKFDKN